MMAYKPDFHACSAILDNFVYASSTIVDSFVVAPFFLRNITFRNFIMN